MESDGNAVGQMATVGLPIGVTVEKNQSKRVSSAKPGKHALTRGGQ